MPLGTRGQSISTRDYQVYLWTKTTASRPVTRRDERGDEHQQRVHDLETPSTLSVLTYNTYSDAPNEDIQQDPAVTITDQAAATID